MRSVQALHGDRSDHLGRLEILRQELDGTEPDDLVRYLVHDAREVALRKDVTLSPQDRERLLARPHATLGSRRVREAPRVDRAAQLLAQVPSDEREWIRTHRPTPAPTLMSRSFARIRHRELRGRALPVT